MARLAVCVALIVAVVAAAPASAGVKIRRSTSYPAFCSVVSVATGSGDLRVGRG